MISDDDNVQNGQINPRFDKLKFLLTNARSLTPKIASLLTAFDEHDLDFALITESWLQDGVVLAQDVLDLEHGTGLKILYKNRQSRVASARAVGGGVSIIYSKASCNFKERKVKGNRFEMVVASGNSKKLNRQLFVFCLYLQPRLLVEDMEELRELLSMEILAIKAKCKDPLLFIGGDLNRKDIEPAFECFPDIKRVNHEPTRGDACLDILYTNASNISSAVSHPLVSAQGIESDHACVVFDLAEPRVRNFVWQTKFRRKYTDKACEEYGNRLLRTDWDLVLTGSDPDHLVDQFENYTAALTDELFPLRKVRRRSNEKPWVTDGVRRISRQKKRVYKREGKSRMWERLQEELTAKLDHSRSQFVQKARSGGMNTGAYFRAVKQLSDLPDSSPWDVGSLFPGSDAAEVGRKVAGYFTAITDQYEPLLPPRAEQPLRGPISMQEVHTKLREAKKPTSTVKGDLPPWIVKRHYGELVKPVTKIFNAVFSSGNWPKKWKTETTVIIPKTPSPNGLAECRNISCTSFLSKVLESVLLEDLRKELAPDESQYGGLKKCSVNHLLVDLLVDLLDNVLRPLDSGNPTVLLALDYEKAFNRLDHAECLKQLKLLGASPASLSLVRSFLTGRSMRVRIGDELSDPKALKGGSPQGSILGCLLYCVATQQIGSKLTRSSNIRIGQDREEEEDDNDPPDLEDGPRGEEGQETEVDQEGFNLLDPRLWPVNQSPPGEVSDSLTNRSPDPHWQEEEIEGIIVYKYIDDTTSIEVVDKNRTIKHFTTSRTKEQVLAEATEAFANAVVKKTEEIGMRVNCAKTKLLCISADNGCDSYASIQVGGERIESVDKIRLLGFMIGQKPGMHDQVALIKGKYRVKLWTLIHLNNAGLVGKELFAMYACFVRPILEANSVIFHSMLTRDQCHQLERLQKYVVKLCFGFEKSYSEIRREQGIRTLEERREEAAKKFVQKTINDERFGPRWFRRRENIDTNIRRRQPYVEDRARTKRFKNSPLLYMQRIANSLYS